MFLPVIQGSSDEVLTTVIRDICGVEIAVPEPEWLRRFNAPGQQSADDEIAEIDSAMQEMYERLQTVERHRSEIRQSLKLLYARDSDLESAVRDVLRRLGADVEEPNDHSDERNKEDGWIIVTIDGQQFDGVLEIKSTKNAQFGEDGVRQLNDWKTRGIVNRDTKYKGIFIGNSSVESEPTERQWPFSDSWVKNAQMHNICAITSSDLYRIYELLSAGTLDSTVFWRDLFETNGVLDARRYLTTDS